MSTKAFKHWLHNLIAATIGGGASSVVSGGIVLMLDAEKFNPLSQFKNFIILTGCAFVGGAITHLMFYLAKSPIWDDDDTNDNNTQKPTTP